LSENITPSVSRKKRFVLIFDELQSVHLFKDVGQVPFQMYKHFGYDAEIVCRGSKEDFLYVDDVLRGLKITVIDESPYRYLARQARTIDVLMLMHISTRSANRGLLYKFLNPGGCLYIKADLTGSQVSYAIRTDQNIFTHLKRLLMRKLLIAYMDVISLETRAAFNGVDIIPVEKRLLLPNGFDPEFIEQYGVRSRSFMEKEDAILLVGRLGDDSKNTELMLDALEIMGDIGGWKVWFVGPMTTEFVQRKNIFLQSNPHLADRVVFTGQIDDKRELYELYSRAKIFCLPSRRESWGMVCVEAMTFGCVSVITAISSAQDLTDGGRHGIIIDSLDPGVWAGRLKEILHDTRLLEHLSVASREYCRQHFVWKNILQPLSENLKMCAENRIA